MLREGKKKNQSVIAFCSSSILSSDPQKNVKQSSSSKLGHKSSSSSSRSRCCHSHEIFSHNYTARFCICGKHWNARKRQFTPIRLNAGAGGGASFHRPSLPQWLPRSLQQSQRGPPCPTRSARGQAHLLRPPLSLCFPPKTWTSSSSAQRSLMTFWWLQPSFISPKCMKMYANLNQA